MALVALLVLMVAVLAGASPSAMRTRTHHNAVLQELQRDPVARRAFCAKVAAHGGGRSCRVVRRPLREFFCASALLMPRGSPGRTVAHAGRRAVHAAPRPARCQDAATCDPHARSGGLGAAGRDRQDVQTRLELLQGDGGSARESSHNSRGEGLELVVVGHLGQYLRNHGPGRRSAAALVVFVCLIMRRRAGSTTCNSIITPTTIPSPTTPV